MFVASVVGGLGSLAGAVLGALFLRGVRWFVPANEWRFLASASGVLLVLLLLPGGLVVVLGLARDASCGASRDGTAQTRRRGVGRPCRRRERARP